ncbi:MAG: restriction endonuclease subunit S, partial [Anaplasmataceae bacterium]|nr:restriction endonuclease subunit S [Anaplasmataceae bacterium]
KTAEIDSAIKNKERLIELLKEQKDIIINDAVTKGLNPKVKMKESGVDWIGKIPEHWEVIKLGALLKSVSIKNRPDLQLLSITREKGVIIRDIDVQESNHNFIPDDLSGYKFIKEGQFGMNKMKAWQGSYGVSEYDGIVSPAYYIFDFTKEIFPPFFHKAIRSSTYVIFFASASDGVRIGQWDLSKTRMKNIPFVVAPSSEQKQIVDYVDKEIKKIATAISTQRQQIKKLKEFKKTLISHAVTGKIKI